MIRTKRNRAQAPLLRLARSAQPAKVSDLAARTAALDELRAGLLAAPPHLPSKYLYDDRGSALFEEITRLPEYFPTRTEAGLLAGRAAELVAAAGGPALSDLIELGSGAAFKTLALIDAARKQGADLRYVAVDISGHALDRTAQLLAHHQPEVPVVRVRGDYTRDLHLPERAGRRLALFLGGTIGNCTDAEALELLSRTRKQLDPGDCFLLGANLVTDPAAIHAAYNDAAGITSAFNLNILQAVNALAGSTFDPADFHHHAPYVAGRRQVEMWLLAKRELVVELGRLGGALRLAKGEGIRTEISRRFNREEILGLLDGAGFVAADWFESEDGRFGLGLGIARGR